MLSSSTGLLIGSEYAATSVDASSQDQLYDRPIAMQ